MSPQAQELTLELAHMTKEYASDLLRFFAKSPVSLMLEIVKAKRANFNCQGRTWLQEYPKNEIDVELACLLIACREISVANRSLSYKDRRGRDEILEADRLMSKLRQEQVTAVVRKPRRKPKQEAIQVRLPMILALREKGYSWRELSTYLGRYAGLGVTHTYLRNTVAMLAGTFRNQDSA